MWSVQTKLAKLSADYERDGYAVIEDFFSPAEVDQLRNESLRLIKSEAFDSIGKPALFSTGDNQRSDYFLNSGDKIRYFFEPNAFEADKHTLKVPQEQSLAKIGHALHAFNPVFKALSQQNKVQDLFKAIGYLEPTIVQSMVIFKNPRVGGEYTPHQDASFLCSEPIRVAGVWVALDDATEENGCLQFIPGSHKSEPLRRRIVRTGKADLLLDWTAPVHHYDMSKFVKVPVKRGSLVLIHGLVVHRSDPNTSEHARWIYTFHIYDKGCSVYSADNWLQEVDHKSFLTLYKVAAV